MSSIVEEEQKVQVTRDDLFFFFFPPYPRHEDLSGVRSELLIPDICRILLCLLHVPYETTLISRVAQPPVTAEVLIGP